MNAANTLPSTPNSTRELHPRTPRGLTKEQGIEILKREETQTAYPNVFKHGVIAFVTFRKSGRIYQAAQRVDGSFSKAVAVPDAIANA